MEKTEQQRIEVTITVNIILGDIVGSAVIQGGDGNNIGVENSVRV